jgi:SAM-dependent methyltransferase
MSHSPNSRVCARLKKTFICSPLGWTLARVLGKRSGSPPGYVRFGSFRRLRPIGPDWGYERGLPLDRYYIEKFIGLHAADVKGHVLEVRDNEYTKRYGGDRVVKSNVISLSADDGSPTIVADITRADHIPSDMFDCIIFTQTLHLIYDVRAAVKTLYRILKPRGVLLVTVPTVSKIASEERSDHWRLTSHSCSTLFREFFPSDQLTITSYGNVLSAIAFLEGLAVPELKKSELEFADPEFEMLVSVRAVKPEMS